MWRTFCIQIGLRSWLIWNKLWNNGRRLDKQTHKSSVPQLVTSAERVHKWLIQNDHILTEYQSKIMYVHYGILGIKSCWRYTPVCIENMAVDHQNVTIVYCFCIHDSTGNRPLHHWCPSLFIIQLGVKLKKTHVSTYETP